MEAVVSLATGDGLIAAACDALGVARATVYRHRARRADPLAASPPKPRSPRALTAGERQTVLDLLREPRFADLAPAEVYATLLDEGIYHCSIRTMYRILADHDEVRERRDQGNRVKPIKSFLRTAITLWVMSARRSVLLSESRLKNRST